MNKITFNRIYSLLIFCLAAAFTLSLPACKKDHIAAPVITEVRNYLPSPNDTSQVSIRDGQWIILIGKNLRGVQQVYFGGVPATINATFMEDESIVVKVPAIPFESVPMDKLNEVTVVGEGGSFTYRINVTGAPIIARVRNYAPAPNDTLVYAIVPGQQVNLVGFNLKNATKIAFQGVEADLTAAVYTDSSVIVKLPDDFSGAVASLANKISYNTKVDSSKYSIIIYDPALLAYYSDPLYTLLAGGIGEEKTWKIDLNLPAGTSTKFNGPMYFGGGGLRWGNQGDWVWEASYQGWMPPIKDYGTMTFALKGKFAVVPALTVKQKNLEQATKNGTFTGGYFMDVNAKVLTFADTNPLRMTWDSVDWTKAYIISLTEDGLQLAFKHKGKNEVEVYNYVKQ